MKDETLENFNTHLFAQLERLRNKELTGDMLNDEIQKAKAVSSLTEGLLDCSLCVLELLNKTIDEAQGVNS